MNSLEKAGLKRTPQRMAIIEYLQGNRIHPAADEVFSAIREKFPAISRATVYNTLRALRDRGELIELSIDPGRKHYDPDTELHHHLFCTGCGCIIDVMRGHQVSIPVKVENEYEIQSARVEIYGLCTECKDLN